MIRRCQRRGLLMWQRRYLIQYSSVFGARTAKRLDSARVPLFKSKTVCVCVWRVVPCTQLVTLGDIWLCIVLFCRPSTAVREKTTAAYLLPSAGLSTAYLHVDGKSIGSLQCAINITNGQFRAALAAFCGCWPPPQVPRDWAVTRRSSASCRGTTHACGSKYMRRRGMMPQGRAHGGERGRSGRLLAVGLHSNMKTNGDTTRDKHKNTS